MRNRRKQPMFGIIAGVSLAGAQAMLASAAIAEDVYVVHGINGLDLGLEESSPVDIRVNDACTDLRGVAFGDISGPVDLPPGQSTVDVLLANPESAEGCQGALVLSENVSVALTESATVVAHLDQNGAPALSKFSQQQAAFSTGESRIVFIHAAAAPKVDITVENTESTVAIETLGNGDQSFALGAPSGDYDVKVFPAGQSATADPLLGATVRLDSQTAYTVVAVGTPGTAADSNTFGVILFPRVLNP